VIVGVGVIDHGALHVPPALFYVHEDKITDHPVFILGFVRLAGLSLGHTGLLKKTTAATGPVTPGRPSQGGYDPT
jgi:hypothetical protein